MKFNLLIIFFLLVSCSTNSTKISSKIPFNASGFAYIYNQKDFNDKLIDGKLDNTQLQISHRSIKTNSLIKIINPDTKEYLILKNYKKINYPDFYKILITKKVATKLKINEELPLVEILEIKKNKSFVAKKAKIFNEEKKLSSNAPVTSVQISNISKNKTKKKIEKRNNFYILIASFYSKETAEFLKKRIKTEIPEYEIKKLKIVKKSNKKIDLISGPYNAINLMKNDYIKLKNFGFEELDFISNE